MNDRDDMRFSPTAEDSDYGTHTPNGAAAETPGVRGGDATPTDAPPAAADVAAPDTRSSASGAALERPPLVPAVADVTEPEAGSEMPVGMPGEGSSRQTVLVEDVTPIVVKSPRAHDEFGGDPLIDSDEAAEESTRDLSQHFATTEILPPTEIRTAAVPVPTPLTLGDRLRRWFGLETHLDEIEAAIAQHPDAAVNYMLRGEYRLRASDYRGAHDDFMRALELANGQVDTATWGVIAQTVQDRALVGLRATVKRLGHEAPAVGFATPIDEPNN